MDLMRMQAWAYMSDLPDDIKPIRDLLHTYSGISWENIDGHLLRMREYAWLISKFPCIGRWKFLNLTDRADRRYQQVLFRLKLPKSRDAVLDLGCCVGQALRQFRADGVDGSRLFGIDLEPKLIQIGYELFRDRDSLNAKFIAGDLIDPDDGRLSQLEGKVTIIHADSFFHLFNWIQQLYIGKRIVGFLKPGTKNALIYGRHVGVSKLRDSANHANSPFLHTKASFQKLWDEVGAMTGTRWSVEVEQDGPTAELLAEFETGALPVKFTIYQMP